MLHDDLQYQFLSMILYFRSSSRVTRSFYFKLFPLLITSLLIVSSITGVTSISRFLDLLRFRSLHD